MIKIDFNNQTQTLTVSGHAQFQTRNDVVCAGVSSIVLGAASYWLQRDDVDVNQKPSGWIQIIFNNGCLTTDSHLRSEFQLMWHQLVILATNYHNYVLVQTQPIWVK